MQPYLLCSGVAGAVHRGRGVGRGLRHVQAQGVRDADELGARWQRLAGEDAALAVRGGLKFDMPVDGTTTFDKPLYEFRMRHR